MTTETISYSNGSFVVEEKPTFSVVKEIPSHLSLQVQHAVLDFIVTSHLPEGIDVDGFYQQTLEAIANCTYMNGAGEFWMGVKDGKLLIYILGHVAKDMDNRMTYHISQGWVHNDYRGNPIVKEWWEAIRQRAKDLFCGHLCITSSRSAKAYQRFLGHGMKEYAILLKETF